MLAVRHTGTLPLLHGLKLRESSAFMLAGGRLLGVGLGRRRTLLELCYLLLFATPAASAWKLGEICEGVNNSMPARSFLSGKTLRILDLEWSPFAVKDSSAPKGWTGFDIDLLDAVAELLEFTYDIHDIGYPAAGSTWTDHVKESVVLGDVTASFWVPSEERYDWIMYLKGHLDLSTVLIARSEDREAKQQARIQKGVIDWETMTACLRPYTSELWLWLMGMLFLSGLVDYILERKVDGTAEFGVGKTIKCPSIGPNLYEYWAGKCHNISTCPRR